MPRTLLCLLFAGGVATYLWFFKLSEYEAELTTERGTEQEFAEALRQIGFISRLRLAQRVRMGSLQAA